MVNSRAEQTEAEEIVKTLQSQYGITVSSPTSIQAIKVTYDRVDPETMKGLQTNVWELKELRGILAAVKHFAPILGTKRQVSPLKDRAQGVTTLGRVKDTFMVNQPGAQIEQGTMGEYMGKKSNVTLFDDQKDLVDRRYVNPLTNKADNATTILANAVHEMAHGLIQPTELGNWVNELEFWLDARTPSGKLNAEDPPTGYGKSAAAEDLCESVAIFFTNRERLKKICPLREAFLSKVVASWTPKEKEIVIEKAKTSTGGGT